MASLIPKGSIVNTLCNLSGQEIQIYSRFKILIIKIFFFNFQEFNHSHGLSLVNPPIELTRTIMDYFSDAHLFTAINSTFNPKEVFVIRLWGFRSSLFLDEKSGIQEWIQNGGEEK